MTIRTPLSDELGIEHPIYAFTVHKEVAAAVSRAGGLGVLGALRFSPEELEDELTWMDEYVDGKPYGVDVVMPASYAGAGIGDLGELMQQLQGMIPDVVGDCVEPPHVDPAGLQRLADLMQEFGLTEQRFDVSALLHPAG